MKYQIVKIFIGLQFITFFLIINYILASDLSVIPITYLWKDLPLGVTNQCPQPLKIKNNSTSVISFQIKAEKPSDLGLDIEDGYSEIPSKRWVTFEKKHIALNPYETISVKMYINIPDKPEYLKKNWEVIVTVKEHFKPSSMLNIVSDVKLFISTVNE